MHAFDRRTDRRPDRNLIARPRLHSIQRGKNVLNISRTRVDGVPTLPGYSLLEQRSIQPLVEWPEKTATLAGNGLLMWVFIKLWKSSNSSTEYHQQTVQFTYQTDTTSAVHHANSITYSCQLSVQKQLFLGETVLAIHNVAPHKGKLQQQ